MPEIIEKRENVKIEGNTHRLISYALQRILQAKEQINNLCIAYADGKGLDGQYRLNENTLELEPHKEVGKEESK